MEQQIVNALVIGSMYSLIAIGFTLYFGILNLINFAHGEVYMVGAFIALLTFRVIAYLDIPDNACITIPLMFTAAIVFCALLGAGIERVAFKPLRKSSPLMLLITSLAVSIIIRESILFFPNGANPQPFKDPFRLQSISFGSAIIGYSQIFSIICSFILIFFLHLFISRTKLGRSMRAISEDPYAAEMMGIDVDKTIRVTFLVGSALAATGGIINGMNYGSIKFDMGFMAGIKGFTAAVFGGLGNPYGAIVGGYILAFLEVLTINFIPGGAAYKDILAFVVLILILVLRPVGILKAKMISENI